MTNAAPQVTSNSMDSTTSY